MSNFDLLVIDPPFGFRDKLQMADVKRSAASQYKTMSNQDIKNLKISELTKNNAVIALWVPSSLLEFGLELMSSWGFKHLQTWIWVKTKKNPLDSLKKQILKLKSLTKDDIINSIDSYDINNILNFGMGHVFRQTHEMCLIGTKGKVYSYLKNKSQRSVCLAKNWNHSSKPEDLQDKLELMFPNADRKIEIFARRYRKNWCCLGNESPLSLNEDISLSLNKLSKLSLAEYQQLISKDISDMSKEWLKI